MNGGQSKTWSFPRELGRKVTLEGEAKREAPVRTEPHPELRAPSPPTADTFCHYLAVTLVTVRLVT
jgi:hypothetical protein